MKKLAKGFWIEIVKRLPYIGLLMIIILLIQGFRTGADVAENVRISKENSEVTKGIGEGNQQLLEKMAEQNTQIKKLSEDNKKLSEQTIRLSDQSVRYQECTFKLFAQYTRDRQPISDFNLDECTAENVIFGTGTTSTGNPGFESQQTPEPQAKPQQPGNSGDNRNRPQETQKPPEPPPENPVQRSLNSVIEFIRSLI